MKGHIVANTYLEFSETIDNLTPEEIVWWQNEADKVGNEDDNTVCYDHQLEDNMVWFHADECGNLEAVALVVQSFLAKFRFNDHFTLTWACWCSKPRIGEFGGGAMFVTAQEAIFYDAHQWVQKRKNELE